MQLLPFLGLVAAIIPACVAKCPSPKQHYYLQSVSTGNYSVAGPSTDLNGPPYANNFETASRSAATQYSFFKNTTSNICQLTFAGTIIKGNSNANQSFILTPTSYPGSSFITPVLIGPPSSESGSSAFTVSDLAYQVAKGSLLSCTVTNQYGTYSTLSQTSTGKLIISNEPASEAQKIKVVKAAVGDE